MLVDQIPWLFTAQNNVPAYRNSKPACQALGLLNAELMLRQGECQVKHRSKGRLHRGAVLSATLRLVASGLPVSVALGRTQSLCESQESASSGLLIYSAAGSN